MPLYIPPVPEEIDAPDPVEILGGSGFEERDDALVATLDIQGVTSPGWLFLQWYGPSLRQVASDSVWLDQSDEPVRLVVALPERVELVEGRWRLVVGFRGGVLRQFETVVGDAGLEGR